MWVLSKGTILASFCVNSSISLSLSYIWLFSTPFGLVKMDPPMEAERTNGETLIWVQSLKGYGQATLKSAKLDKPARLTIVTDCETSAATP